MFLIDPQEAPLVELWVVEDLVEVGYVEESLVA
jgi:hypothetical protein